MDTIVWRWRRPLALALATWLAAAGSAAAGSFSLAPVRLELDHGRTTGVVTLRNDADEPVTIQVESVAWSQPDGADRYDATRDLIVTPPVFVVPPKGEQIIRVARRAAADVGHELDYRLFFNEVPSSTPQSGTGLRVALRVGIPVFVAAAGAAPELTFAAATDAAGAVEITATNAGRGHVQITDFEVRSASGEVVGAVRGSRYLLAGSSAHWTLTTAAGQPPGGVLRIHGHSDRGDVAGEVALAAH